MSDLPNCDCAMLHWWFWGGNPTYMFKQSSICQSRKICGQVWSDKIYWRQKGIKTITDSRLIFIDRLWILRFEQIWTDHSLMQYILNLLNLQFPMWAKGLSVGPWRQYSQALRWRTSKTRSWRLEGDPQIWDTGFKEWWENWVAAFYGTPNGRLLDWCKATPGLWIHLLLQTHQDPDFSEWVNWNSFGFQKSGFHILLVQLSTSWLTWKPHNPSLFPTTSAGFLMNGSQQWRLSTRTSHLSCRRWRLYCVCGP